jgi:UDP-hydrolysing UDP-N-acetyl-D-glucosamine 2-epimerase
MEATNSRGSAARGTVTRRICVVTGTRADYGILQPLLREIQEDSRFSLQIVATGMHLSPEFGLTYRAIEGDGFSVNRKIEILMSSDSPVGMSKAVGLGVLGFADALADMNPDIMVVLGDRFEIFSAVQAAFLAGVPVAHIAGGELTEGAVDDVLRHCISKMSRYHFVAEEEYRSRVIQLGESPDSVFTVGHLGLDNIGRVALMSRDEFAQSLEAAVTDPFLLTTFHPATAGTDDSQAALQALLTALDDFPAYHILFTGPNADPGSRALAKIVERYVAQHPGRATLTTSLGQRRYLSAMKHCAAVIGNSSSGIVEAPAMGKPTVNIGGRQKGRLRAASVADCDATPAAISAALTRALSSEFRDEAVRIGTLHGAFDASKRIRYLLGELDLTRPWPKRFHDLQR